LNVEKQALIDNICRVFYKYCYNINKFHENCLLKGDFRHIFSVKFAFLPINISTSSYQF